VFITMRGEKLLYSDDLNNAQCLLWHRKWYDMQSTTSLTVQVQVPSRLIILYLKPPLQMDNSQAFDVLSSIASKSARQGCWN